MAPTTDPTAIPNRVVQSLESHTGAVNVVRYNTGGKYCLSGSSDRSIRLWNPASGKEIKKYEGHGREVLGLDISHDNAKFASCGGDKQVYVWDVASGTVTRRLQGHFGKINAVAFNQDAQVLASAGFDAKIMIWDMRAASRDPLQTLKDSTTSITSLSMPSNAGLAEIISSDTEGFIRTHDLRLGRLIEDCIGHPVYGVVPSPQSPKDSLLATCGDGSLRIMDRSNGTCLQTFSLPTKGGEVGDDHDGQGGRCRPAWGYGEGTVISGDEDGRVWAWNVLDAKPLEGYPMKAHRKAITWIETSANGKEMITASADGSIKVWTKGG